MGFASPRCDSRAFRAILLFVYVAEYVLCHKQVLVEPKANFVRHLLSDRHLVAYVTQRARCSESVPVLAEYILCDLIQSRISNNNMFYNFTMNLKFKKHRAVADKSDSPMYGNYFPGYLITD